MPDSAPAANPKAAREAIEIPKPKPQEIEEAPLNSFSYIEALKEQVGFSSGKESELKHQHMDWSQKYYLKWFMFGFVLLINVIWTVGIFRILVDWFSRLWLSPRQQRPYYSRINLDWEFCGASGYRSSTSFSGRDQITGVTRGRTAPTASVHWNNMFDWLFAPSKSFAEGMEIAFSVGLFLTTFLVVIGLIGEYRDGDWWKRKIHIFEILVVLGVAGEMVTETGAFWYSLRLQSIEESAITAAQKTANQSPLSAGKLGVTVDNFQGFVVQKEHEADTQFDKLKLYVAAENEKDAAVIAELDKDKDTLDKARDDAVASEVSAKKVLADMTSELEAQRQVRERRQQSWHHATFRTHR